MVSVVGTVKELWRYPVKSMIGESVDSAQIDSYGVLATDCGPCVTMMPVKLLACVKNLNCYSARRFIATSPVAKPSPTSDWN
ncbi:MAG: hypothetical protein ACI9Z9_002154 [Litorivivens sp.]|jgi:hypothetical protein